MLTVIGDLVEDVVVWTDGPYRHGTDNPASIVRARGGSAANVAAQAARLTPTRFIGRIGDDPTGDALVAELAATGVEVLVQRGGRTGTVVVVVDPADGERTMYPDRAAAAELAPVDPGWLAGTSILHVPAYGFSTEPTASSLERAADTVRGAGGRISVDVSAVTVVERYGRDRFAGLLDRLAPSVVFANRAEADVLGTALRPAPGGLVVVKDGPRPARLVDEGGETFVDAEPMTQVEDTTGAGDAFAAGFLAAWGVGADPVDACSAGHRCAAAVLRVPGAG